MSAVSDQVTADLVAFVQTCDPAESLTQLRHVAGFLSELPRFEDVSILAPVLAGLIGGFVEQIATKPGGIEPAEVSYDASVLHQVSRGIAQLVAESQR